MSQAATAWRVAAVAAMSAAAVVAQSVPALRSDATLAWRKLGQPAINADLAGLASGPVASVWYSADGGRLFAKLPSGLTFETSDFERWSPSAATSKPEATPQILVPSTMPEPQARIVTAAGDSRHEWALGRNLFVSEDSGRTWTNMSSGSGDPVIGSGQRDIAVNTANPETVAVANEFGVWQTRDGGQSWAGLNDGLPNLPVSRILSTRRGALRIVLNDGRTLGLSDARAPWAPVTGESALAAELAERQQIGKALGVEITAAAHSGDSVFAGSTDGRIWVSRDHGVTWGSPQQAGRGAVVRFFIDADAPRAALAVMLGQGSHVSRTVNGGGIWDDITGNLGDATVHAAVADRASQTAYVATDRGIFEARVDLNALVNPSPWVPVGGVLPKARVMDLSLDAASGQLFAALDGYGLFTAPLVPKGFAGNALRIANAADFSSRPAAPGSLISISGGRVTSAKAGDLDFPLLAAGEFEAQMQVPFEAKSPSVDISIQAATGATTLPLAVRNVSPAIFIDRDGAPFLVDADSGLTLATDAAAHPRTRIELMATGLGRVQPDWPTGIPAPAGNTPKVVANVQAFLDGVPLEVTKSTLAPGYVGYYLVEIELPAILNAGPAELYLMADGQESNRVRLMVDAQ